MQNKTFDNYDCNLLSSKINLISNFGVGAKDLVDFYKQQYSKNNCDKIIQDSAFKEVDKITDKYQKIDKERIETESFLQRNNKLILGAVVLIAGLLIVATINKD